MKIINGTNYYTTTEICSITNHKRSTVLKYARKIGNLFFSGEGRGIVYYWTEKDLKEYQNYINKVSNKEIKRKQKPATNIMTLYQRRCRAKKNNDIEKLNLIEKQIIDYKKQNNLI